MGMQLHLVHRGLDGAEGQQVRQLLRREVGNTDRVNQTLRITHLPQPYSLHELLHLRPRALQVFHVVAETILGIIRDKANVVVTVTLVSPSCPPPPSDSRRSASGSDTGQGTAAGAPSSSAAAPAPYPPASSP